MLREAIANKQDVVCLDLRSDERIRMGWQTHRQNESNDHERQERTRR